MVYKGKKKKYFLAVFLAFWGLGFAHFVVTTKDQAYLGLWDCSPFLHMHTNVDQLDSGIAVHSTDMHQQASVSANSGLPETLTPWVHSFLPLPAVCNS